MKLGKIAFALILGLFFIFSACDKADNVTGDDNAGSSSGDLKHSGTISKNETWSKDKIHIIDDYLVIENATLTIEPGTVVKFMQNSAISVGEAGGLIADGTSEAIKFTGNVEQNGYWRYIEFGRTAKNSDCKLINCIIEYGGGYADYSSSIVIYNNATVKNCTIKNSKSSGVYIDHAAAPVFMDNTVTACDKYPVNTFFSRVNYIGYGNYTGNSLDYLYLGESEITKNSTIRKQDISYLIDGYATVTNAILTIEAGTTVKFDANSQLYINENGGLIARGKASDMIVFTGKIEQKGYWQFISFKSTAVSASSIMDYCKIEYGGGYADYSASVIVENNATITNCIIQNSKSKGVYFDDEAEPVFHDNTVTLNELFPVEAYMSNVSFIGVGDYSGNTSGHDYLFIKEATYNHVGTLLKQNVPYLFNGYCNIENGTLTVQPGTEIDFNSGSALFISANGGFVADGTQELIKLSGYIKQKGYWYYITFSDDSDVNNCLINNCLVEYGGGYADYSAMIELKNGATITNNTIQHSGSWGITYYSTKNPTISGNTFSDCDSGNIKDNS